MKELEVAFKAARAGVAVINKYIGREFKISKKGEINLVTEVDVKAQKAICDVLLKAFPKDSILAEEGDLSKTAKSPRRWIVDPIDGTTNFAHGYPRFCVSIGFEMNGQMQCGVIHDPSMEEIFHAVRGKGAFLNKKKIKVSKISKLKEALLVTGFPYDLYDPATDNIPYFLHLLKKCQAIRRDGSAALNLAYVAAGRFDGFWELGLSPWDVAAGLLMIEEAGGKISDFEGKKAGIKNKNIVTGNPQIFKQLLSEVMKTPK
ncbi:MAG: inositol monophosphatase [Deltaproteobacteria bacterium]|nr:inositol monophosphatase [Deltaproteobacteria bacterium]